MANSSAADSAAIPRPREVWPYDNSLTLVTAIIVAMISYDRLAVGFIAPYIVAAFGLSNFQIGSLVSVLGLAVAVCGFTAGRLAEAKGWGKQIVVGALALYAVCCVLTAIAPSFGFLLATRFLTGVAIGPITTVSQAMLTGQSNPARLGVNVGAQNLIIYLLSQMAGPVILIALASHLGWHAAFLASALPAVIMATCYAAFIKPMARPVAATAESAAAAGPPKAPNNIWICLVIFVLMMGWMIVNPTFLSRYLADERHFDSAQMGVILGVLGASAAVGGVSLPVLSNRVGRKPIALLGCTGAVAFPLVVQFFHGPLPLYAGALFLTWMLPVGAMSVFLLIIPGESGGLGKTAGNIAMIMGAGEAFGVISPIIGGRVADSFGLPSIFWFTAGLGACALASAFLLKETRVRAIAA